MSKFTLYRADVDSPRLARLLGTVPGVAVEGEQAADETPGEATDDEPPVETTDGSEDDGGLRGKVPDTDILDEEKASVVKTYGLLGLGVSMVTLGIATVGIWVYLRRSGDGDESETPPPTTGMDTGGTAPTATGPATGEPESEPSTPSPSIVTPDDEPETEPHGRTETDRSEVEWETRDTTPASEPETTDEPAVDGSESSESERDGKRPTESVDAAPLLGVAFLALSGAVVNWLQSDDEA